MRCRRFICLSMHLRSYSRPASKTSSMGCLVRQTTNARLPVIATDSRSIRSWAVGTTSTPGMASTARTAHTNTTHPLTMHLIFTLRLPYCQSSLSTHFRRVRPATDNHVIRGGVFTLPTGIWYGALWGDHRWASFWSLSRPCEPCWMRSSMTRWTMRSTSPALSTGASRPMRSSSSVDASACR